MSKQARQYDSWIVLRDLLEKEGVARQHLNSYNEFISKGLQSIIDEIGEVEIETVSTPYKVKFGKVELGRPRVIEIDGSVSNVFPMEARLRNLSYASPIFLDMTIEEEGMSREATRQQIGDLPVMVRSDLCQLSKMTKEQLIAASEDPNDQGGYFIINGSERVIVGLEDSRPTRSSSMWRRRGASSPTRPASILLSSAIAPSSRQPSSRTVRSTSRSPAARSTCPSSSSCEPWA